MNTVRGGWTALLRSLADPGLLRLRAASVTFATALVSALLACIPAVALGVGDSIVVLAVMLSISFTAERAGSRPVDRVLSLVLLPVVGVAAGAVGLLMVQVPLIGDVTFVLVLSAGIWMRRFGQLAARIGTLVALPFIAVLVVPVPVGHGRAFVPWAAVVALVVALVALALQWVARAAGVLPATTSHPTAARERRPSRMRPIASTRMAVQMAVTLTCAFVLGHLVFGQHWFWAVLTAYIVSSGNRGRGDVLFKGIHRTVGAVAGTLLAALLSFAAPAGAATGVTAGMLVLAIAVILALGLWLRPAGYGWWAAAMTAMLSLLHELDGTEPGPAMLIRLAAIVTAGALAVVVAWWVLPVRTGDALRARTAAALGALSELLVACIREPDAVGRHRAVFDGALGALRQLGPTLRLERAARVRGRSRDHRADIIPALEACWAPADSVAAEIEHGHPLPSQSAKELGSLVRRLGECRRMLVGGPPPATGQPAGERLVDEHTAAAALGDLSAAIDGLVPPLALIARPPENAPDER
jgi:hypothetical protein